MSGSRTACAANGVRFEVANILISDNIHALNAIIELGREYIRIIQKVRAVIVIIYSY